MRIQVVQMEVTPGNPLKNFNKMKTEIEKALYAKADLCVFSELCLSGYLLGDLWEQQSFLTECQLMGEKIRDLAEGISIIFGNIALEPTKKNEDGRIRKYNALFFAEDKKFISPQNGLHPFHIKTLLPNYREFDDSRYFTSLEKVAIENQKMPHELLGVFPSKLGNIAGIICEDAWDDDYHLKPIEILKSQSPLCFINISCSPFTLSKKAKRNRLFSEKAQKSQRPILYVNNTGIQNNGKTVYTFDGDSTVYLPTGKNISLFEPYEENAKTIDLKQLEPTEQKEPSEIEQIFKCLQYGTKKFLEAIGIKKVVIGASGGIDSAVAAAIYRTILDETDLLLVNMPSRYNSKTTINLSKDLAKNLDCYFCEVSIEESLSLTTKQIHGLAIKSLTRGEEAKLQLSDFNTENIQARDRSGRILAAIAAAFGGAFTSNANKSETTVGYSTLYGDHAGFLANLADLWKFRVYELGHYLNDVVFKKEVIPAGTFTIPPSAELSNKQNVDKGMGDPIQYEYHDRLFSSWVEFWVRATPEDALLWYIEGTFGKRLGLNKKLSTWFKTPKEWVEDLERWWALYQGMGVAKRIQAPPILAVTRRAFGFDHRESQLKPYYSQNYHKLKAEVLSQDTFK